MKNKTLTAYAATKRFFSVIRRVVRCIYLGCVVAGAIALRHNDRPVPGPPRSVTIPAVKEIKT